MLYEDMALFSVMQKDTTNLGGEATNISINYAPISGGSHDFATAQQNRKAAKYIKYLVTRAPDFTTLAISYELQLASGNDRFAIAKALKTEGDTALNTAERSIAHDLYGNGGGARGQIASGSGTTTITLVDINDIVFFEVGMVLHSDDTDGSSGGASDGEDITILSVDRDLGTITKEGAGFWNANGNFAANDFLFRAGDFGLAAKGLAAALPATAPTLGDDFFGGDRSPDPTRLAGVRFEADSALDITIKRALLRCAGRLDREGGRPDCVVLDIQSWYQLAKELENNVQYNKMVANGTKGPIADIGIETIAMSTPVGKMNIIGDRDCPRGRGYMLTKNTWTIYSLGPGLPHWFDADGRIWAREPTTMNLEARMCSFWQPFCEKAGKNATMDLSAVIEAA